MIFQRINKINKKTSIRFSRDVPFLKQKATKIDRRIKAVFKQISDSPLFTLSFFLCLCMGLTPALYPWICPLNTAEMRVYIHWPRKVFLMGGVKNTVNKNHILRGCTLVVNIRANHRVGTPTALLRTTMKRMETFYVVCVISVWWIMSRLQSTWGLDYAVCGWAKQWNSIQRCYWPSIQCWIEKRVHGFTRLR